jgi:glycosyltransferase involved in cell wall biosynthesis
MIVRAMPLRYLFIHQNFPAQFVHVSRALAAAGHEVVALSMKPREVPGVRVVGYRCKAPRTGEPLAQDFNVKMARAAACAEAMRQLSAGGFRPHVVVAHPGWGEALFVKDIWPQARLIVYAEYFYGTEGGDHAFGNAGAPRDEAASMRLRMRNTVHLHAFNDADAIYAPTQWQRSRLPPPYRAGCEVIFDGIDTQAAAPDPHAYVRLVRQQLTLRPGDEVLTFVNRNLEPYRGFDVFMRALPRILAQRPHAHCLIVGRDGVSYGAPPPGGGSWRELMLREVGAQLPLDRVHFLGQLSHANYLKVLQVSACHVYMSYPFVLSWSCLEAMSAGCAVLASDTAPVREVIRDGVNGALFDFFDIESLAQTAAAMLAAGNEPYRQRARETVVAGYDLKSVCLPRQLAFLTPPVA